MKPLKLSLLAKLLLQEKKYTTTRISRRRIIFQGRAKLNSTQLQHDFFIDVYRRHLNCIGGKSRHARQETFLVFLLTHVVPHASRATLLTLFAAHSR